MVNLEMLKPFFEPMIAVYLEYGPFVGIVFYLLSYFVVKILNMLLDKTYNLIDAYTTEIFGAWTEHAVASIKKKINKKHNKNDKNKRK